MAYLSLRMLWLCLFAATALNCLNYTFKFYDSDGRGATKYYDPHTESDMGTPRSLASSEDMIKTISYNYNTEAALTINVREIFYNNNTITNTTNNSGEVHYCPELPPGLGEYIISSKAKQFNAKYSGVKTGGIYKPSACQSRQSVAVIIAYRGCKKSLITFLQFLHPFLIKQQLDYQIFVVEQSNNTQHFNRGMLLNIGFIEAQKHRKNGWNCILFHEAHIVPTDSRNLYRCSWYPKQLAVFVERPLLYPYVPMFGGAVALTPEQYLKVNGFSNNYWGNDADFEDLYNRMLQANYVIEKSLANLGRYKTLDKYSGAVRLKSEYIPTASPLYLLDGLTSLTYKVELFEEKPMYTYLKVYIGDANDTESYKLHDKLLNPTPTVQIHLKATTVTTKLTTIPPNSGLKNKLKKIVV